MNIDDLNLICKSIEWNRSQKKKQIDGRISSFFEHRKINELLFLCEEIRKYNELHDVKMGILYENGNIVNVIEEKNSL